MYVYEIKMHVEGKRMKQFMDEMLTINQSVKSQDETEEGTKMPTH